MIDMPTGTYKLAYTPYNPWGALDTLLEIEVIK